jgi:hypothetical protein
MALGDLFRGADRVIGGGTEPVAKYVPMGSDESDDRALLEEYETLRNKTFRQYLMNMTEDERFYRLDFGEDLIPEEWKSRGFEPTIPPTAYNAVEAASNHILTTPDIMVPERPSTMTSSIDEQMIASLKTQALSYFWHQVFKQGDPLGHVKKDMVKFGKMVLKKTIDYEAFNPTGVAVGRSQFPWSVKHLSPSQVFEDEARPHDPMFVYEAYETNRQDAERLFPESKGIWKKKDALDTVRILEYWEKPNKRSRGRRIVWVDDERVINKPNPYHWVTSLTDSGQELYDGYVPYFIADSGWGDGDTGAAPHERYVGLIRRIHSLLKTEARQLTAADAQLRIGTFPLIKIMGIEEDDEHPIKLGPGAKIHLNDKEQDVSAVEWPRLDPALFAIVSRVHTYVNELAQFEVLSGSPQPGVDSATEADQNYRAASAKLGGILSGMKSVITRMNETVFMDVEHIFEAPVTLYGAADGAPGVIELDPEWIAGFYENFVELKTSDQRALDAANAVRWANLYQVFGLDAEYAMKMAGIPNPRQRLARRAEENVFNDPRMHELRVAQAMQGMGPAGEMASQIVLQNMITGSPDAAGATPPPQPQPPEQGGGAFAAPPIGMDNARGQNPMEQQVGQAPPPQQNIARAVGFNRSLMLRPDLAFGR